MIVPQGGANGVVVADGGRFGGYSLFLRDGKPAFSYNFLGIETTRWQGATPVGPGRHSLTFEFAYAAPGFGKGGAGTLIVDGKTVATNKMAHSTPFTFPWFEGLDVGGDYSTPVDRNYTVPNKFTGTVVSVTFKTSPMQISRSQMPAYMAGLFNAGMGIQ